MLKLTAEPIYSYSGLSHLHAEDPLRPARRESIFEITPFQIIPEVSIAVPKKPITT